MQTNSIQTSPSQIRPPLPQQTERLETAFLEEMLKYAGPKPMTEAFGGGVGEEQFSTFLTREYAAALSASLDFGFTLAPAGAA